MVVDQDDQGFSEKPNGQTVEDAANRDKNSRGSSAPIFISYQWDFQDSAQRLKHSLEKNGFRCWMDIGEINGDEPLQEAIQKALKQSELVILCFNEKYLDSENCSKEIKLAQEWNKPIISLIMEPAKFPPEKNQDLSFLGKHPSFVFYVKDEASQDAWPVWPKKSYDAFIKKLSETVSKLSPRGSPSEKTSNNRLHILISCSPDKNFEMKNLCNRLEAYGYNCKIMKISEGSLSSIECEVIIAGLSLRYMKSSVTSNEIVALSKIGRPIIPLLLDNITYPPPGQTKPVFSRLDPVECYHMPIRSRDHWNTEETEEILDRLESLVPNVHPIRLPRREKSNIPLAKDHVRSLAQPVPQDPLAREASEIRIQIRPPTPDKDGSSHIPVPTQPQRKRANSLPTTASDSTVEDESEGTDTDDDSHSTDSEVRTAKELQRSYKLPQLRNGRRNSQSNGTNQTYGRKSPVIKQRPTYGRGPPPTQKSTPTVSNGHPVIQQKPVQRRQNFYNPDGPKLPSVYRKKFAVH